MSAGPVAAGTARHARGTTKNRVGAFIGLSSAIGYGLINTSKSSSGSMAMSNYRNELITTAEERAAYIQRVQKNAEKHGLFFTIILGEAIEAAEHENNL